jgi:hypothetical protein
MIPGLGGGLSLSGGSSEAKSAVDSDVSGAAGFTLNANKGIDAKTVLALAVPAVLVVGLAVVAIKAGSN